MKIVGFTLTKILIQRKEKIEGKLQVNQNIDIKDVVSEHLQFVKDEALKINFKFIIDYSGDSAKVEFEGYLIIIAEKDEFKKIQESWEKKQVPDDLRIPLFNFIMSKCNIKALTLEDEMALPPHLPLPRISPENLQKTD